MVPSIVLNLMLYRLSGLAIPAAASLVKVQYASPSDSDTALTSWKYCCTWDSSLASSVTGRPRGKNSVSRSPIASCHRRYWNSIRCDAGRSHSGSFVGLFLVLVLVIDEPDLFEACGDGVAHGRDERVGDQLCSGG